MLYVVAFVAQVSCEIMSATLREWLTLGIPPQLQLRILGIVWSIDVLLTPAAVVAAAATGARRSIPAAPLAMLGVAAVLAVIAPGPQPASIRRTPGSRPCTVSALTPADRRVPDR